MHLVVAKAQLVQAQENLDLKDVSNWVSTLSCQASNQSISVFTARWENIKNSTKHHLVKSLFV
jgi:hypothetical protein